MNRTGIEWTKLLEASKDARDALAAACRVIAHSDKTMDMFEQELSKTTVKPGFGKGKGGQMKCPYCGRRVGDMPDHLGANPRCHLEHTKSLKSQLAQVLEAHREKTKPSGEEQSDA